MTQVPIMPGIDISSHLTRSQFRVGASFSTGVVDVHTPIQFAIPDLTIKSKSIV